ncbi:hypothetical protein [Vibrio gallaecicus]|nr:hypothetical protein [Vibrio gallaecicus]MDN3617442.1 hypothetical protein [Vibrio gallaecicus]
MRVVFCGLYVNQLGKRSYNKAFKTDSQRSALLVQVSFGVYGAMV